MIERCEIFFINTQGEKLVEVLSSYAPHFFRGQSILLQYNENVFEENEVLVKKQFIVVDSRQSFDFSNYICEHILFVIIQEQDEENISSATVIQ